MDNWPANVPLGISLRGPDLDADAQMLVALGAVVRAASMWEFSLRMLFCALEESKFAAVTAAGQEAGWLAEMCRALLDRHTEINEQHRAALTKLLSDAGQAMRDRNRFIHDAWVTGQDGVPNLMRSWRRKHELTFTPKTTNDLVGTARTLNSSSGALINWICEALGPEVAGLEAQLRWEEGRSATSADI
ncbi:hypothetical protein [Frankia sp. R82]|uniref:hypothetical protein n=1 Tax=Frankia sp. R82 TaxID=2950553 RepID=UPI0020435B80|nr:hypothetical protein [Frankia sp. R82]MCM3886151.1 hypothetical protein [Frankia sp. R82]